ncbi:MAG: arylsulfatase [Planctomycetes bacterium]|nr:arylsulfatase [Planctomycetota bacterium]
MIRRNSILFFGLILFLVLAGVSFSAEQNGTKRPNIIVILSDDMGYSDIGCYGSEIETPNLDSLAAGGLRFTQFYNTGRCCPTRASLLSGLYPHQAGVGHMINDRGVDGYRGELNKQCVTIAEALKGSGYSTYMTGKWHVTGGIKVDGPKFNWPMQRGFDRFYGTICGSGSFWDPSTLVRDNTMITVPTDKQYQPKETYYYTDAISDNACKYIKEHKSDQPFFMYVAYTAAHWPMHARERDIAKYKGKYDGGYDPVYKDRFKKMKDIGVIKPDAEISPRAGDWSKVKDKKWESACMEVYAAMVDNMDQGIGRIVKSLKEKGEFDNTLILFMQDNGGCAEGIGRGDKPNPRKDKPSFDPVPAGEQFYSGSRPKQTRDGWPVRTGRVMPGPADTYIAYGRNWANVSNVPFRLYKHWVHEGGISTPLVVSWPKGIKAKNELRHQPGHLIDIMATCVDVAAAKYPKKYKGKKIKPMEGKSLLPVFAGKRIEREAIYWEHEGNRAVRAGKWKLVAKGKKGKWELYDIDADRSELHDLSGKDPKRTGEMAEMWNVYAKRANVIPWPNAKKKNKRATGKKTRNKK